MVGVGRRAVGFGKQVSSHDTSPDVLEADHVFGDKVPDEVVAHVNVLGFAGNLRGLGEVDSTKRVLPNDGGVGLGKATCFKETAETKDTLGAGSKGDILSFTGTNSNTGRLFTGVGIEGGIGGTNAEVVARLRLAISMDCMGGIDSGREGRAVLGVVGTSFRREGFEVSKGLGNLAEVVDRGARVGTAGMASFLQNVGADTGGEVETASDLAVRSLRRGSGVGRGFEEVRVGRGQGAREVGSAEGMEHLQDVGFEVEGYSTVGGTGDANTTVLGGDSIIGDRPVAAIAGIKGGFEVREVLRCSGEDLAVIDDHTHDGFALGVGRVNLAEDLVVHRGGEKTGEGDGVEAGTGKGLGEVRREHSI